MCHAAARAGGQVRLDPATDWSQLSAGQLKAIIKERGLDCKGCAERADFERRLKEFVAASAAGM